MLLHKLKTYRSMEETFNLQSTLTSHRVEQKGLKKTVFIDLQKQCHWFMGRFHSLKQFEFKKSKNFKMKKKI